MAFVRGHPRDLGWVMAHRRRPNRAEGGQLPLIGDGAVDPVPAGGVADGDRADGDRAEGDGAAGRVGASAAADADGDLLTGANGTLAR